MPQRAGQLSTQAAQQGDLYKYLGPILSHDAPATLNLDGRTQEEAVSAMESRAIPLGKAGGPVLDLVSCCGSDVEKRRRLEAMLTESPQRCVVRLRSPSPLR